MDFSSPRREPPAGSLGVCVAVVVAGLMAVGCSIGDSRPAPPSTAEPGFDATTSAMEGRRYADIVAPFDGAVATFASASEALPPNASVDDFVMIVRPLVDVTARVDIAVRAAEWPTPVAHDIKAELRADEALIADLKGTLDVTLILAVWRAQIIGAARKVTRAEMAVKTDLR